MCGVCFIIITFSSFFVLVPREAVLRNCGIAWVFSLNGEHTIHIKSSQAITYIYLMCRLIWKTSVSRNMNIIKVIEVVHGIADHHPSSSDF